MDYQEIYKSKLTDVAGALSLIHDGDKVVSGGVGVEPAACLGQLHTLNGKVRGIRFMTGLGMKSFPFMTDPACKEMIQADCIFLMVPGRESHRKGLLNVLPGHLHNAAVRWTDAHGLPDVCIVAVTPMDRHGYFRIPLCLIHERFYIDNAKKVIVEVNPRLPVVFGDTEVHVRDVDCIVEAEYDLPTIEPSAPDSEERVIGQYIAELVHDGDCIQLGIGGIPDAAAHALTGKRDLGVHTEMLTNSLVDLVEAGVITGAKKTLHRGKIVGAFALGNHRLYDMIDENPGVALMKGGYVNLPSVIAQNDNFVSINTGMNVDLGGQICSESIGSLHYSGSGGQADTAIGALHAKGGRNIIALKSTKKLRSGTTISSIHAQLPLGSVVSMSRNDIDYIVTEYGIAQMRGRSVRERVDSLIAVAHPDFRSELRRDAQRLLLW